MHITFAPRGIVQIDDARIINRNFRGEASKYNREGDRNFCVVIPDQEIADALMTDKNQYGIGWNVKIKAPREEGDEPLMFLSVKVKFNNRGPYVHLVTGGKRVTLDEESVSILDKIYISHVDMDIRPYDDEFGGKPFRSAYLQSICVYQDVRDRFAEEEYPEE